MSLLLEALKKAELAKEAVKKAAQVTGEAPFTRDQLPDITQPMEIHSEDMRPAAPPPAPKRADKPVLELALEEPLRAAPAGESAPAMRGTPVDVSYSPPGEPSYSPERETAERKQAQQLFEAKELDVNPRKPFYLTMGALGVFALGTVGYFWYEMQPKNNYKIPPPLAQTASPPAAASATQAAPATAADTPAAATVTPPVGTPPAVPPTGDSTARAAALAAPVTSPAAPRNPASARQSAPGVPTDAAAAPQRRPAPSESDIRITPARVQTDPLLEGAFQAFNSGDLPRARADYRQVLRANPDSRDALLGLAAVETQAKHYETADGYYSRLLELDPRDAHAQAGLIGLRGQVDPLAAESRLKNMIAAQPEAGFLNFTLGNQYAAQGRWAEAQQAYFQAYASDPEHPDFAYNLAISLDRMHQSQPALEYYRRALALAEGRPISFDQALVRKRVAQLER